MSSLTNKFNAHDPAIESNSFGINLQETFHTAGFGGERLDVAPTPSADPSMGMNL
jgi:hypothetical protein